MPRTQKKPKSKRPKAQSPPSSFEKTEVLINVYDLLPPGKLATTLWWLGSSLLHTGVVIKALNREYAFGGHDRPNVSGVYWTKPGMEPPGGIFRSELLQGFTFKSDVEIEEIVLEVSQRFTGPSYNLLSNNCNHFTNFLCEKLTNKAAPSWLNRAASIGIALPCMVPREWISPPDHDTADGELLEEDEEDEEDERTNMLRRDYERAHSFQRSGSAEAEWDSDGDCWRGRKGNGKMPARDSDGRDMPTSERAHPPERL